MYVRRCFASIKYLILTYLIFLRSKLTNAVRLFASCVRLCWRTLVRRSRRRTARSCAWRRRSWSWDWRLLWTARTSVRTAATLLPCARAIPSRRSRRARIFPTRAARRSPSVRTRRRSAYTRTCRRRWSTLDTSKMVPSIRKNRKNPCACPNRSRTSLSVGQRPPMWCPAMSALPIRFLRHRLARNETKRDVD